jgi:hypothetical protein
LLAVNSTPIDVVNRMLVPYLNADNQSGILTNRPWVMLKSEMLVHLGVVRDAAHPRLLFRLADGRLRRVDMPPLTTDDWNVMWNTPVTATMPDTYTRQFEGNYATVVGHDVVYAFNSVDADNTEAIATMNAALTSGTADRVIFDMQYCGGGGFSTAQEALDALLTPLVDRPRRLLVITGRDNQSAASVVAEVLEHGSGALFVGEEPPTKPNPMTDETTFTLPNSQIVVHVPTYQHVFDAHDSRAGLTPDYPVAPLARAFFAGRDNLLAAAVAVTR